MYTAGAVIGQLPFTFLFPMFPMNYTIPGLEIGWGIFTLLQYRTQGYGELMAYRFMVGIFEVCGLLMAPSHKTNYECRRLSFLECIMSWAHGTGVTSWAVAAVFST